MFRIEWTDELRAQVEWRQQTDSYGHHVWPVTPAGVVDLRAFVEAARHLGEKERLMAGGLDPGDGFEFTAAHMAIALASLERQEAAKTARKERAA